ncbi:MAG: hypothetical protein JEZ11_08705 [Desulfobacterales bacterium]|nr:hypothetical protein [Desulfobacterales bacterium]
MIFSEDSRVKIPCILHLVRLGYRYLSLKNVKWDEDTNIFPDIFRESMININSGIELEDIERLLDDVKLTLDNEDLGQAFYEKLTERSGTKLIDFVDFANNSFHVVTELTYKNGDDEFRPDIILLINGMPLVFIEVKKPNNRDGIQRQIASNIDQGAFFKSFNVKAIEVLSVLRPPEFIEKSFEDSVSPVCTKRHHLMLENQQLTQLRDWLLPILMNGQVTVA